MADSRSHCRRGPILTAAIAASVVSPLATRATEASWMSPTSGSWTNVARWSSVPNYPDNGSPPGAVYDATIAATGAGYVVTFLTNAAVRSLTLDSPTLEFSHVAGTLQSSTGVTFNSGLYDALAGTLATPLLTGAASGATFRVSRDFTFAPGMTLAMPVTVTRDGTLTLPGGLALANGATVSVAGSLWAGGSLSGAGTILLAGSPMYGSSTGTPLTIGPNVTVATTPTGWGSLYNSVVNYGTISAVGTPLRPLSLVSVSSFANYGTLEARDGGTLHLNVKPTFSNAGTIAVSGTGKLSVDGTLTSAADLGTLVRTGGGGTVNLVGTLDNTGRTVANDAFAGPWQLNDLGTIRGGTVTGSPGSEFVATSGARLGDPANVPCTLDGVTLDTDFRVVNTTVDVVNGITLTGKRVTLPAGGTLRLNASTPALGPSGDVVVDGGNVTLTAPSSASFTIAPGVTVRTSPGAAAGGGVGTVPASYEGKSYTLVNRGLISAQAAGRSLTATASVLQNEGTLEALAGATLTVQNLVNAPGGSVVARGAGAVVNLNGSWANDGGVVRADGGTLNLGGSFTPAALADVSSPNGGAVNVTGTLSLNSSTVTLGSSLALGLGAGGQILGPGTIASADSTPLVVRGVGARASNVTVDAPVAVGAGAGVTFVSATLNRPTVVTGGGSLTLSGAGWTNASAVSVTGQSTLVLSGTPAAVGSISVTDSTLRVASSTSITTAMLRPISMTNSRISVYFNAVLDNTGDTLALSPATATLTLASGGVKGGTISGPAGVPVVFSSVDVTGSLDGVTLAADATVIPASALSFANGLTLDHAHIAISPGPAGTGTTPPASASLASSMTQTLGGIGTITFEGTGTAGLRSGPGTLTIGPGVTIRTGANSGFVGQSVSVAPLVVNGSVSAETPGTKVTVYGAPLTNNGSLAASNSATLAISAQSFTNSGTISVDATSTLLLTGGSASDPNGTINLSGTGVFNYSGASPVAVVRQQLALGRGGVTGIVLSAVASDPNRAIGYVEAAVLLNLTGAQTATWAGQTVDATTLLLKPTIFGDANLDGTVNADDYALLDRGYAKGRGDWVNGDFDYDGSVTSADYLLIDAAFARQSGGAPAGFIAEREARFGADYVAALVASVPEPSSAAWVVAGLAAVGRRRGTGRKPA